MSEMRSGAPTPGHPVLSNDPDTPLCVDCKHARWTDRADPMTYKCECSESLSRHLDVVTGEPEYSTCRMMRTMGPCGKAGLLFELPDPEPAPDAP